MANFQKQIGKYSFCSGIIKQSTLILHSLGHDPLGKENISE